MRYIAFDLGAESGRVVVGTLLDSRLHLEEVHRFPNEPVFVRGSLHWDILRLFYEIKKGLAIAVGRYGTDVKSLAIDTWGVDFGLLSENGLLLQNPYHYRDGRTQGMLEETFKVVPREEIFEQTGIQFMAINTLYQLLAFRKMQPVMFSQVQTLLMIPDLFNYFLTGIIASEATIASTSQMYNPRSGSWSGELLKSLGIPEEILPAIHLPGTVLGSLLDEVGREAAAAGEIAVVATGSHDTASAVAAVPAQTSEFMYISSGTWSLIGVEVASPVINKDTLALNFTNEGGVGGTIRLLRNVVGLWLVQECRRYWEREGENLNYDQITAMARGAKPLISFIDPDHPVFFKPDNMPAAIQAFCRQTGQPVPQTKGEIIRCALESLALKYRWVLEKLEDILEKRLPVIHMIGGGIQNELLCQFTADASGRVVLAGPVEATAAGNILVQAMAMGEVASLVEIKSIVRSSIGVKTYEPDQTNMWEEAYQNYKGNYLDNKEK